MTIEEPSFILSTRTSMTGSETFDAAVLFVRASDDFWAKFCLENSPAGAPTIVSVVTRGVSDDCNSVTLARPDVYLRVAKTPNTLAFHYSLDARYWHMVRYFSLGTLASVQVGFVAQSPLGRGSQVRFSDFAYRGGEIGNLRDGQ
jgi:regulation of enolase protein 1 (concanavalin A-like superfamily)